MVSSAQEPAPFQIRWSLQTKGPLTVHGFALDVQPRNSLVPWFPENGKLLASAMFFWSLSPEVKGLLDGSKQAKFT